MLEPRYPHRGVWTAAGLEAALGCQAEKLVALCGKRARLYYTWDEPKSKGGVRTISAVLEPLKGIQSRIKNNFLRKVEFPQYLQGSIHDPVTARNALTNARIHEGARFIYTADVKSFFDNVREDKVRRIWKSFFRFAPDISEILVGLTTLDGHLPQGAPTSPGLANLVFFDEEPWLVEQLRLLGFNYSRYVDDITFSAREKADKATIAEAVSLVHAMVKSQGLWLARKKQHFSSDLEKSSGKRRPVKITGYEVGREVSMPRERRRSIEVDLYRLELDVVAAPDFVDIERRFRSLSSKVGQMKSLHPGDFRHGKAVLGKVKKWLDQNRPVAGNEMPVGGARLTAQPVAVAPS